MGTVDKKLVAAIRRETLRALSTEDAAIVRRAVVSVDNPTLTAELSVDRLNQGYAYLHNLLDSLKGVKRPKVGVAPVGPGTVYVVAWEYDGGGGFDWYRAKTDTDVAFVEEQKNADELVDEHWTAVQFDFEVPEKMSAEDLTERIQYSIWNTGMFASAAKRYQGATKPV